MSLQKCPLSGCYSSGRALGDVDFEAVFNALLGPDTFQRALGITFVVNTLKGLGTLAAGTLYQVALAASSGATRQRLERLDFYFNTANIWEQALFNFLLILTYFLGRLFVDFAIYGPALTIQGIQQGSLQDTVTNMFSSPLPGILSWQFFFEFVSLFFGYLILAGIWQSLNGPNLRLRKREAAFPKDHANLEHLFLSNVERIINNIRS